MNNKAEATQMQPQTQRGLTPPLRFPEFRDAPEWSYSFGNDVFEPINNKQHDSSLPVLAITQEYGAIPRDAIDYQVSVTEKSIESYKVVEVGDFIISLRSFQGGIEYSQYHGICSPAYIILRMKTEDSEAYFKHFFKTDRFIQQLNKNIEGLRDGKMVSYKQFSELLLPIPSLPEQQKIAGCLTSLDDLIAAHSQKLAALRAYKKGLLQHLFPPEGETLPRLRFPEFQHAGEWEIRQLGDLLLSSPDYGVNAPAVPYSEDLPAYLRITDISDEGHYLRDNKVSVDIDARAENYLSEGDIVLARTGASVGKSYKYRREDGKLVFAGYLIRVKPDQKSIDSTFLLNFLSTQQYWKWVGVTSMRSGQPGINSSEYATLSIPVPPTGNEGKLSEQRKIADCLTSLDVLIAAQSQKLAALTAHKKGLLQQLFPSPEEAQG